MSLETQLRDALAARADDLDRPAFDPYERVTGAVGASHRRRRAASVGAVAAVAAVAVLVPSLAQGDHRSTLPAKRTQIVIPGPSDPRWNSLSTWPTRGSLATDTGFLTAVGSQFATSHILYAADLATSRVVVSWDPETDTDGKLTMFSGRRGGSAQDLAAVSSSSGGQEDLVTVREHADNDSTLVLLTRPGVREAAISRSVQIGLDGSVARDGFRAVRLNDGAYSELLEDSPASLTRVKAGDGPSARVTLTGLPSKGVESEGSICLNCVGDDFRAKAEQAIGAGDAYNLGLRPQDVRTSTRFYGTVDPQVVVRSDLGVKGPTTSRVIVVDSTLPEGQVLRSAMVVVNAKDGSAASTMESATGVPIDAATAADRPFVLDRRLDDGRVLHQVFAPTAASVQLVSEGTLAYPSTAIVPVRNSSALVTTPLTDPAVSSYEVATYDASGKELGRWPIALPSEDQWTAGTTP